MQTKDLTAAKPLTVRRAADRKEMVRQIKELAASLGASVEVGEGGLRGDRCVHLTIGTQRDLKASFTLDGASRQPDVHVVHWHVEPRSTTKLSRSFGGVNEIHFGKATHTTEGFDGLLGLLRGALHAANDGSAFQN